MESHCPNTTIGQALVTFKNRQSACNSITSTFHLAHYDRMCSSESTTISEHMKIKETINNLKDQDDYGRILKKLKPLPQPVSLDDNINRQCCTVFAFQSITGKTASFLANKQGTKWMMNTKSGSYLSDGLQPKVRLRLPRWT